jgi:tRNA threonylcarbamoyladenosine biosynthesis protein TsaB
VSILLHIDTAVQTASVCLAEDNTPVGLKINPTQKDHAAWLQVAIRDLLAEKHMTLQQVDAFGISAGPGSYTGLRVGMATVKGLCYALHKPLIMVNTLQMMASAAPIMEGALLCPMIDARRMEVFTAVYNSSLDEVMAPTNLILDENSFNNLLDSHTILFFGNGSVKFQPVVKSPNAVFEKVETSAQNMAKLAFQLFLKQIFADIAYSEPYYGKDFHSFTQKH